MRDKIRNLWKTLRSNYWFIPAIMSMGAIMLAAVTLTLDYWDSIQINFAWLYGGGAAGARDLLSTVAGSMMTVAGVTFSITIVALTLAASQFGSRLLQTFIHDTGTQVVLGTFVATFLYCLLVLKEVRGPEESQFVPELSITVGIFLAIASLAVLIYFINHIAKSLSASHVVAEVGHELSRAVDDRIPQYWGKAPPEEGHWHGVADRPPDFEENAKRVRATETGYLSTVNGADLLGLGTDEELIIQLVRRPGDFVWEGITLTLAWPAEAVTEEIEQSIQSAFHFSDRRNTTQDVAFAVQQLVEVALRALSPSLNDPFTAMACIDWLGAALAALAQSDTPSPYRYDDDGRLRLIQYPVTFAEIVGLSFDQLREAAHPHKKVTQHLLQTIDNLLECAHTPEQRIALQQQLELIHGVEADETYPEEYPNEEHPRRA